MPLTLQVITGPLEGKTYSIEDGKTISVGRGHQNDIVLSYDPWISSSHALIKSSADGVCVMDLNSSNGSFVLGKKIPPNDHIPVKEYFILGSTLWRIAKDVKPLEGEPMSLRGSTRSPILQHPLVREALRLTREKRSPMVGVLHLFSAVLDMEQPEVMRFLKALKFDMTRLRHRLDKLHIFEARNQWINDFLMYQFRSHKNQDECLITPLVQDLIHKHGSSGDFDPVLFLKLMMNENFSLLFPLLGIDGPDGGKILDNHTDKITLNPYDCDYKEIILPIRFWRNLNEELVSNQLIVLSGGPGTGKTTIMKQCFHAFPKVEIPSLKDVKKRIFDPSVFLVFNEAEDLVPYLKTIIHELGSDRLVGIDHLGYLLQIMKEQNVDPRPLIKAVNNRFSPTILGIRDDLLSEIQDQLVNPVCITMENYLKKVSEEILNNIITDFETESKCRVSNKAKDFLRDQLFSKYNYIGLESFLSYCSEQIQSFSFLYTELSWSSEKRAKHLSSAFFKFMLTNFNTPFG